MKRLAEVVFEADFVGKHREDCGRAFVYAGPSNWSKIYPKAAGEKQSPIDIVQKNVQSDPFLAENPLRWNYKGLHCTNLLNTGCGWRADVTAQGPSESHPTSLYLCWG